MNCDNVIHVKQITIQPNEISDCLKSLKHANLGVIAEHFIGAKENICVYIGRSFSQFLAFGSCACDNFEN